MQKEIEENTLRDLFIKVDRILQERSRKKRNNLYEDIKKYVDYRSRENKITNERLLSYLKEISERIRKGQKALKNIFK